LHALFFVFAFLGPGRFWGFDWWSFLPAGERVTLLIAPLAATVLIVIIEGRHRPPPAGEARFTPIEWSAFILSLVAAPFLFWGFRDGTHLLGDGILIAGHTVAGEVHSKSAPLANRVTQTVFDLFGTDPIDSRRALEILSVACGVSFVALVAGLWRALAARRWKRWAGLLLFLLHPTLLFFFGYIEFYPLGWVFACGTILTSLLVIRGKIPPWVAVAAWTVSVGAHSLHALYLPLIVGALGSAYALRSGTKTTRRVFGLLAHCVAGIAVAVALLLAFRVNILEPFLQGEEAPRFLSLTQSGPDAGADTIFDHSHFFNLMNHAVLVLPLLPLLPLWIIVRRRLARDTFCLSLLVTAALSLGIMVFINPKLGMARDWDLLAVPALPVLLAAVLLILGGNERARPPWESSRMYRLLLLLLLFTGGARTFAWIHLNHDPAFAVARARHIASETTLGSDFARSYAYENLSYYSHLNGDDRTARRDAARAEELRPGNPRLAFWVGSLALDAKEYREAEAAFLRTLALDSTHAKAWGGLGRTYVERMDGERGEVMLRRSLALDPTNIETRVNLGLTLVALGRPEEAFDQAVRIDGLSERAEAKARAIGKIADALLMTGYGEQGAKARRLLQTK